MMTTLSFTIKSFLFVEKMTNTKKRTLFQHSACQPAHTSTLPSEHSTSSQLCIDVIQIEQVSTTAQVTHTFTLLDYIKPII